MMRFAGPSTTELAILAALLAGCGGRGTAGIDADAEAWDGGPTDARDAVPDPDAPADLDATTDGDPDTDEDPGEDPDDGNEQDAEPGSFHLELPLTDGTATRTVVEALGGHVRGGSFGTGGWTTTSRDDIIVIPLPEGIDATRGRLAFSVTGFEWELTSTFWEAWILVSLDGRGEPFAPTATGEAGLQSLYQGYNPDDSTQGYRPVAYLNLADPGCSDWRDCTGEARTSAFWLRNDGTTYTLSHEWDGPVDRVGFAGTATVNRTIDLGATSPAGRIRASRLFLMINACGGSTANTCGPWGGPVELKGGPIGVTYSALTLEIPAG